MSMLPITFLCPSINPLMKAKLARINNQVATHEKVFTYNSPTYEAHLLSHFPMKSGSSQLAQVHAPSFPKTFPRLPTYLCFSIH